MYGYDDLGRLTNADWSTGAQTRDYDYDSIGNLERIGVNESLSGDGEVLFGYDPNPSSDNSPVLSSMNTYQGVTLTSSHTVVTDSAGNISDDGQAGYDYTLRNQLESRTLGVETSSYTFSADGRRVGMTRGATTLDVVLGLGGRRLSRVLDGATRDYVWLGDTLIGYFDGTATEPVRVVTSHIGFPLMAVDETGTTIWEPLHEPYGELIGTFSKSADPGLRYPGQWQDEVDIEGNCVGDNCTMPGPLGGSVSLFENGFRWYRTAWGRYSQSDPLGLWGGMNLYRYAYANPARFIDRVGLAYSSSGNRDPFLPLMPGDDYSSGYWGERPDVTCCKKEKIDTSARVVKLQIKRLDNNEPLEGVIGGMIAGVPVDIPDRPGWYYERPMPSDPPFDPTIPQGLDPCVEFCSRVHEWFHFMDRRPRNWDWAGSYYLWFTERPAYVHQLDCLRSF